MRESAVVVVEVDWDWDVDRLRIDDWIYVDWTRGLEGEGLYKSKLFGEGELQISSG